MINRVVLVGRLTKDPDLRYTSNGTAVANFTVACNKFKKEGEEQQADFINCVIWRKAAESLANYQKKGNLIGVEGRIQTRNYEGNDGKRVYVTEVLAESVQFLEPKPQGSQGGQQYQQPQQQGQQQNQQAHDPYAGQAQQVKLSDDELPF